MRSPLPVRPLRPRPMHPRSCGPCPLSGSLRVVQVLEVAQVCPHPVDLDLRLPATVPAAPRDALDLRDRGDRLGHHVLDPAAGGHAYAAPDPDRLLVPSCPVQAPLPTRPPPADPQRGVTASAVEE